MTPAPSVEPITAALQTALAAVTGRPVGRGRKPDGAVPPYTFLTRVGLVWTGTLGEPWREAELTYQVQCVAFDALVVELLEAKAGAVILGPLTIADWDLVRAAPLGSPGIRTDRDPDPANPLLFSTPQWSIWAQPTA